MYIVVSTPTSGDWAGACHWTVYPSKEDFDASRKAPMLDGSGQTVGEAYRIIAEGVTEEEAMRICSCPQSVARGEQAHQKEMLNRLLSLA